MSTSKREARDDEIASAVPGNLDELPRLDGIPTTIGMIALVLALTLPTDHISWSGWIYFSMAILVPLHKWFLSRRAPA